MATHLGRGGRRLMASGSSAARICLLALLQLAEAADFCDCVYPCSLRLHVGLLLSGCCRQHNILPLFHRVSGEFSLLPQEKGGALHPQGPRYPHPLAVVLYILHLPTLETPPDNVLILFSISINILKDLGGEK